MIGEFINQSSSTADFLLMTKFLFYSINRV